MSNIQHIFELTYPVFSAGSAEHVIPTSGLRDGLESMIRGAVQSTRNTTLIIKIIPDSKRQQTTTVDNKRLFNGLVLTDGVSLHCTQNGNTMTDKKPFEKESTTKISFPELMELIGTCCDYKFCIIDDTIDEELMKLAASQGIDLNGFKLVIETSGIQHSENRHGKQSKDREPLSLEDYLLVPFIIRNRDKVSISTSKSKRHEMGIVVYEKLIGSNYYYVEEIRTGKKSLAFQTLYKRTTKNPSVEGL